MKKEANGEDAGQMRAAAGGRQVPGISGPVLEMPETSLELLPGSHLPTLTNSEGSKEPKFFPRKAFVSTDFKIQTKHALPAHLLQIFDSSSPIIKTLHVRAP